MKPGKLFTLLFAVLVAISLSACGGAEGGSGEVVTLTVQPDGNDMLFQQEELTVEAGQEVRLVFENTATAASMMHNVVFLNTNDSSEADEVGDAGFNAGPGNEYVPDDDRVLAFTPVANPGETVEVTFTAPDTPGEYIYFCTYPGHHRMMRGVLKVT